MDRVRLKSPTTGNFVGAISNLLPLSEQQLVNCGTVELMDNAFVFHRKECHVHGGQ